MGEKVIMVSIHCLAFNHEKYIRKTLEGFVSQKTNFQYEILIHDDASTDRTPDIIKEYEQKYPEIIKPIYQKENQYTKGVKILRQYNFPRAKGKYIAFCEGDDYWCDERKLQKQVDILENHPECSFCTHFANMISEDGSEVIGSVPATTLGEGVIEKETFLRYELLNGWASQTSSFLIPAKYLKEYFEERPKYNAKMLVGDFPMVLYLITRGKVYFCNERMSCYRVNSAGSFNARKDKNILLSLRHLYTLLDGVIEYNAYTDYKYDKLIKAYVVSKLEEIQKVEKEVLKEYDSIYFEEVYRGKARHLRYFIRRKMPHLYNFLLSGWRFLIR